MCRAPHDEATELVRALYDKGLSFDFAYALPPASGGSWRQQSSPVLDAGAMRLLREEMGMTAASMARRMLAVVSLKTSGDMKESVMEGFQEVSRTAEELRRSVERVPERVWVEIFEPQLWS